MFSQFKTAMCAGSLLAASTAWANHPVLVEGNCDSPVPGTTIVSPGTCGDFDGDGLIGTAEDTDGTDRIFGTIKAALSAGVDDAADTGAEVNGTVTIVTSGRFAELLEISPAVAANPGNVTLKAAPGVEAQIDAVLQGDPSGKNATRQNGVGIVVIMPANRRVTLENLTIRNYQFGIVAGGTSQLSIVNCRIFNNLDYGVRAQGSARVFVDRSDISSNGFRIGGPSSVANPGGGVAFFESSSGGVSRSRITFNAGKGVTDTSGGGVNNVDNLNFGNGP